MVYLSLWLWVVSPKLSITAGGLCVCVSMKKESRTGLVCVCCARQPVVCCGCGRLCVYRGEPSCVPPPHRGRERRRERGNVFHPSAFFPATLFLISSFSFIQFLTHRSSLYHFSFFHHLVPSLYHCIPTSSHNAPPSPHFLSLSSFLWLFRFAHILSLQSAVESYFLRISFPNTKAWSQARNKISERIPSFIVNLQKISESFSEKKMYIFMYLHAAVTAMTVFHNMSS